MVKNALLLLIIVANFIGCADTGTQTTELSKNCTVKEENKAYCSCLRECVTQNSSLNDPMNMKCVNKCPPLNILDTGENAYNDACCWNN